jgi:RNA polymerase sigma-70 factor (ECF subfamily)
MAVPSAPSKTRERSPKDGGPSDAQAIERARGGDHEAFRVLVERYQSRAHALALRVLRDEEQARDAVQDAFLKVYRSLDRFEGRSSFYTWLYRLVMNVCLDLRRRDRSDRHLEWDETRGVEPMAGAAPLAGAEGSLDFGPADAAMRRELREQLATAIDELPVAARETLILREVEGLSYAEIAEALSIPKGTVMSRLHYARRQVREILASQVAADGKPDAEGGGRSSLDAPEDAEGGGRS